MPKTIPVQARALETVATIVEVSGRVLDEGGVEKLNTNLVAERAGISVPTLYRYFPNKYAILGALGGFAIELIQFPAPLQVLADLKHWRG